MIRWYRLLALLAPFRWLRALREAMAGVRLSPSAVVIGGRSRVRLAGGSKIGARCRLDAGSKGVIEVGERVWLSTDIEVQTDSRVIIGAGTTIQRRCTINGSARVGAGCIFAPDVFVSSGTHPFRHVPYLPIRVQEQLLARDSMTVASIDRPVWIQDDCWLGVHVVVAPGVTIGKGSVIGANAVVTRDVPPYSVMGGIPARRIGSRLDWVPPRVVDPGIPETEPYILSGKVANECIRLEGEWPVHVALEANAKFRSVAVSYRCARPSSVAVGARTVMLRGGEGRVEFTRDEVTVRDGVVYFQMQLSDAAQPDVGIALIESLP